MCIYIYIYIYEPKTAMHSRCQSATNSTEFSCLRRALSAPTTTTTTTSE